LDEIQKKVLRVFLLAIQSSLYSFALRFLFLLYTVNEKRGKPERKSHPLHYILRNPFSNLKSEKDYAQTPQRNCTFMNSASGKHVRTFFVKNVPKLN
jgi:hypothetical protein